MKGKLKVFPTVKERKQKGRKAPVCFWAPKAMVEALDELVERGYFTDRSEALRTALYEFIKNHYMMERERKAVKPVVGYR
ncbi:MAG: ribbon-helix-helix domain-containing protein [Thermofilaceae archaeon]